MLAVAAEVFERQNQHYRLLESERELHLITDDAPVYLARFDQKVCFRFINQAYAEGASTFARSRLTGKHLSEVIGAEAFELVRPQIETVLSGHRLGTNWRFPTRRSAPASCAAPTFR